MPEWSATAQWLKMSSVASEIASLEVEVTRENDLMTIFESYATKAEGGGVGRRSEADLCITVVLYRDTARIE
jgi:hypothetical protein